MEGVAFQFKVISWYFPGGTEKTTNTSVGIAEVTGRDWTSAEHKTGTSTPDPARLGGSLSQPMYQIYRS